MINIKETKTEVRGTTYKHWEADFRSTPDGFTKKEWEKKLPQLIAGAFIPKSKRVKFSKKDFTKAQVKQKCQVIISEAKKGFDVSGSDTVTDLFAAGEWVVDDDSNSGDKKLINAGKYLSRRYEQDHKLDGLSLNTLIYEQGFCKKMVSICGNEVWNEIDEVDANDIVNKLKAHCFDHANKLETDDLTRASSYGTLKRNFNLLKTISRGVRKHFKFNDVFAYADRPVQPRSTANYKDARKERTTVGNVDGVLYFAEQSYLKGIHNRPEHLQKLWHEQFALTVAVYCQTGMRRGEFLALEWSDLKLVETDTGEYGELTINKSFTVNTGELHEAKSQDSHRKVIINEKLYKRLMAYKEMQVESDLMFPNTVGKYDKRNRFGRALRSGNRSVHGDKKSLWITIHGLRHYYATQFLNDATGTLSDLSILLGHSEEATTEKSYIDSREIPETRLQDIANRIGASQSA